MLGIQIGTDVLSIISDPDVVQTVCKGYQHPSQELTIEKQCTLFLVKTLFTDHIFSS